MGHQRKTRFRRARKLSCIVTLPVLGKQLHKPRCLNDKLLRDIAGLDSATIHVFIEANLVRSITGDRSGNRRNPIPPRIRQETKFGTKPAPLIILMMKVAFQKKTDRPAVNSMNSIVGSPYQLE